MGYRTSLFIDDWVEPIGKDRKKKEDTDGCEIFMLLLLKEIEGTTASPECSNH